MLIYALFAVLLVYQIVTFLRTKKQDKDSDTNTQLKEKYDDVRKKYDDLNEDHEILMKKHDNLLHDFSVVRGQLNSLNVEHADLMEKYQNMETLVKRYEAEIADLKNQIKTLKEVF